jgi:hypothetical protein
MKLEQRKLLGRFILYEHLFRVSGLPKVDQLTDTALDPNHPCVKAFRSGLLKPPFADAMDLTKVSTYLLFLVLGIKFIIQIFGSCLSPMNFIATIYHGRQIVTADQVISRIEIMPFNKEAEHYDEAIHHKGIEKRFERLLKKYLIGKGQLASRVLGISQAEAEQSAKASPLIRSAAFLQTITGSSYLPGDPEDTFSVSIFHCSRAVGAYHVAI